MTISLFIDSISASFCQPSLSPLYKKVSFTLKGPPPYRGGRSDSHYENGGMLSFGGPGPQKCVLATCVDSKFCAQAAER